MAPHEDIDAPSLKFVFSTEFDVRKPVILPNGPKGTRVMIPIVPGGTFQGGDGHEDFHGTIIAPSSDWATMYLDNEPGLYLDVQFVFKTHEGDIVLGKVEGRSERDPQNAANAEIHSSISFETGAEKHKWMNKKVFAGKGLKEGAHLKLNYYEIV